MPEKLGMWYSGSSRRSIHWKSRPRLSFHIKFVIRDWWKLLKLEVIRWYLDHQEELDAHILGFRSTHQYYKTAKYELHRATGHGDIIHNIFVDSALTILNVNTLSFLYKLNGSCTLKSSEKCYGWYLQDQWPDEAHILQFCSTDEYFETSEYERLTPLGDRDIVR